MRIGVVLDLADARVGEVSSCAEQVEAAGLDMLWLRSSPARPEEALAAAASLASAAPALQVGAHVHLAGQHPIYVAEERNVVDQLLGGRLVVALEAPSGEADTLAEWTQVLLLAAGTTPFRHVGQHYAIPAGLPENSVNPETRVVVTPRPFALEPQVWVSGPDAVQVAGEYGVALLDLAHGDEPRWSDLAAFLGRRSIRLRRPGIRTWDPAGEDATDLAARLKGERDASGLDTALVHVATRPGGREWQSALADLASVVRPRVQMDRLPDGLEAFWNEQRHSGPHRPSPDGVASQHDTPAPQIDREAMT